MKYTRIEDECGLITEDFEIEVSELIQLEEARYKLKTETKEKEVVIEVDGYTFKPKSFFEMMQELLKALSLHLSSHDLLADQILQRYGLTVFSKGGLEIKSYAVLIEDIQNLLDELG